MPRRRLQRAMRLPGPPTCSFCGADDAAVVLAGQRAFICGDCVADTVSHRDAAPAAAACALCGRAYGSRGGWWWRRRRVVALARGGVTACDLCLDQVRSILARDGA